MKNGQYYIRIGLVSLIVACTLSSAGYAAGDDARDIYYEAGASTDSDINSHLSTGSITDTQEEPDTREQEKIYVKGDDGTIIPFPSYTKYVSGYFSMALNFSKDKGTESDPIVIKEPSFLLQIISKMINALSDAARDVYGKPVAITHVVYPEVYSSKAGEEDVSKSIILVSPLVKKAIQPSIPIVSNTIDNKALRDLTGIAEYLEMPSLTNALSSYISDQVFYYMGPFITPNATPRDLLPNLKTALLEDNLDGSSYPLSEPVLISILKHLKLKKLGVVEKSVADYIGENGQPPVYRYNDTIINLFDKDITSLIGLDLILSKKEITRLVLANNHILGSNFDQGILGKSLFDKWESLSELNLTGNKLQTLPDNIFRGLTALKRLHLNHNQLQSLPENIFKELTVLEILFLSSNQLQTLPENIFQGLTALIFLDLDVNELQSLPDNIFQGLTNLKCLHLHHNLLQSLPDNMFHGLTALESLYLNDNHLQKLPENIFQGLTALNFLDLAYNQLQSLPDTIFHGLTNLKCLHLHHNLLQSLPDNMFHGLTALESLYLNDNQLQTLPDNIFKRLSALLHLEINNNFLPGGRQKFINRLSLQHIANVWFYPQNTPHQPMKT